MMSLNNFILKLISLSLIIALIGCTKSEPSDIQKESFIKSFGGAYEDEASDLISDNGNYYILGNKKDNIGKKHIYVVKTDEFGNLVWEKTFSNNNKQTIGNQIIKLNKQTGFAIIGSIEIDTDSLFYDSYLLVIDENGEILKEKTYSNRSFNDYGKCIAELENGGFVVSTLKSNITQANIDSIYILTLNSDLDLLIKSLRIEGSEIYQICQKTDKSGFYFTAYSTEPIIVILDSDGLYGGSMKFGSINGIIKGIIQDDTGKTFVCGKLNSGTNGKNDGFISELEDVEESIDYTWLKEYGDSGDDHFEHITITNDNNILVTGSIENTILNTYDIWVVKTDIIGNLISEDKHGGNDNEYGIRILESENNKFVIESTTYFENNAMISILKTELN